LCKKIKQHGRNVNRLLTSVRVPKLPLLLSKAVSSLQSPEFHFVSGRFSRPLPDYSFLVTSGPIRQLDEWQREKKTHVLLRGLRK